MRSLPAPLFLFLLLSFHPYLLITTISVSAVSDLNSQGQALLGFLHGLNGAPRVKNWSNNSTPCSWIGVGCNSAQNAIQTLKLPGTGLSGHILPNTLGLLPQLKVLSLRNNKLSGPLPSDLANCTQLRSVFLQNNLLTGSILAFNGSSMPGLTVIDLSFNQFTGDIPPSFMTLNHLKVLLLQNNSLSGVIPAAIDATGNLAQLNLSNNNLSGSIPTQLKSFPISTFSGNVDLCGPPLSAPCQGPLLSPSSPPSPSTVFQQPSVPRRRKLTILKIVLIVVGGACFVCLVVACCLLCWWKNYTSKSLAGEKPTKPTRAFVKSSDDSKDEYSAAQEPEHNQLVFFQGSRHTFDLEDLLRASAEVLGKGNFGTTYKAIMEDGSTVVVKRLKDVSVGRKEFTQQMDVIGRLRGRNVVSMRAYYYSKEEKLLVHDYLPMESLSAALHGSTTSAERPALNWERRLKIARAAARGVAQLHGTSSKFTHGDIKSSNVLLERQHDACVSDFGLASLFSSNAAVSRLVNGYRAPEVLETRKVTQKSDVYSFGVLLLELLTGKIPSQTSTEQGMDLPRWVQSVVREEWTSEVFDAELMKYPNIEEEMVQMLQIALTCVSIAPDQRPKMAEVLKMIEEVRHFDEIDEGNTNSTSTEEKSNESMEKSNESVEKSNESAAAAESSVPLQESLSSPTDQSS